MHHPNQSASSAVSSLGGVSSSAARSLARLEVCLGLEADGTDDFDEALTAEALAADGLAGELGLRSRRGERAGERVAAAAAELSTPGLALGLGVGLKKLCIVAILRTQKQKPLMCRENGG